MGCLTTYYWEELSCYYPLYYDAVTVTIYYVWRKQGSNTLVYYQIQCLDLILCKGISNLWKLFRRFTLFLPIWNTKWMLKPATKTKHIWEMEYGRLCVCLHAKFKHPRISMIKVVIEEKKKRYGKQPPTPKHVHYWTSSKRVQFWTSASQTKMFLPWLLLAVILQMVVPCLTAWVEGAAWFENCLSLCLH